MDKEKKHKIWRGIARIALGGFLVFAGTGHLTFSRTEFLAEVPKWVPFNPDLVVVLSGVWALWSTGVWAVWRNTNRSRSIR